MQGGFRIGLGLGFRLVLGWFMVVLEWFSGLVLGWSRVLGWFSLGLRLV